MHVILHKKSKYFTYGKTDAFAESVLKIIDRIIERNAFAAHQENLILNLTIDKRDHVR